MESVELTDKATGAVTANMEDRRGHVWYLAREVRATPPCPVREPAFVVVQAGSEAGGAPRGQRAVLLSADALWLCRSRRCRQCSQRSQDWIARGGW